MMEDTLLTSREIEFEKFLAAKSISNSLSREDETADETMVSQLLMKQPYGIIGVSVIDAPVTDYVLYSIDDSTEESPFDEIDEKRTTEEKIDKLIDFVREESRIQSAEELAAKLDFLHEVVSEDPDEDPISIDSIRNFVSFLQNTTYLKCPSITLTPSNEIHAQWRTAPNRHFAAIFLPNGEARYVIFTPNSKNSEMIDRISGLTSVDSLLETVRPHNVLAWASI